MSLGLMVWDYLRNLINDWLVSGKSASPLDTIHLIMRSELFRIEIRIMQSKLMGLLNLVIFDFYCFTPSSSRAFNIQIEWFHTSTQSFFIFFSNWMMIFINSFLETNAHKLMMMENGFPLKFVNSFLQRIIRKSFRASVKTRLFCDTAASQNRQSDGIMEQHSFIT